MDMQAAIKELQETAIVMAGIQSMQADVVKGHADWLVHEQSIRRHADWLVQHEQAILRQEAIMARVELGLAEATDKLNALIDIVDGRQHPSS